MSKHTDNAIAQSQQRLRKLLLRSVTAAAVAALAVACASRPEQEADVSYTALALAPAAFAGVRDQRANFRNLFCGSEDRADDAADACAQALRHFGDEGPVDRQVSTEGLPRERYLVALALGIGWDCVDKLIETENLPSTTLRDAGYDTLLLPVEGLSSSERNAAIIADTLRAQAHREERLILIGYSKGATDVLEALQRYPELAERTAAVITVAGAVGGSPVADEASASAATSFLRLSPYGDCGKGDGGALASMRPTLRHRWLYENLPLPYASYSMATAPEPDRVSRALLSSYEVLGAVHPLNDGALLSWDQLLPGSTLLGYANADHWAVTVPIHVGDVPFGGLLLRNEYPRTHLWRTLVDFVVADIEHSAAADDAGQRQTPANP
jgi:pimeloyl-ACP methyl ester carboxylesterase